MGYSFFLSIFLWHLGGVSFASECAKNFALIALPEERIILSEQGSLYTDRELEAFRRARQTGIVASGALGLAGSTKNLPTSKEKENQNSDDQNSRTKIWNPYMLPIIANGLVEEDMGGIPSNTSWKNFLLQIELNADPKANNQIKENIERKYDDLLKKTKNIFQQSDKDFLSKLDDFRKVVIEEYLEDYCRSQAKLKDVLEKFCGNCEAQTYLITSVLQDAKIKIPSQYSLGIQFFVDHVRPVVFDHEKKVLYDLVTGVVGTKIKEPIFRSTIIPYSYAKQEFYTNPQYSNHLLKYSAHDFLIHQGDFSEPGKRNLAQNNSIAKDLYLKKFLKRRSDINSKKNNSIKANSIIFYDIDSKYCFTDCSLPPRVAKIKFDKLGSKEDLDSSMIYGGEVRIPRGGLSPEELIENIRMQYGLSSAKKIYQRRTSSQFALEILEKINQEELLIEDLFELENELRQVENQGAKGLANYLEAFRMHDFIIDWGEIKLKPKFILEKDSKNIFALPMEKHGDFDKKRKTIIVFSEGKENKFIQDEFIVREEKLFAQLQRKPEKAGDFMEEAYINFLQRVNDSKDFSSLKNLFGDMDDILNIEPEQLERSQLLLRSINVVNNFLASRGGWDYFIAKFLHDTQKVLDAEQLDKKMKELYSLQAKIWAKDSAKTLMQFDELTEDEKIIVIKSLQSSNYRNYYACSSLSESIQMHFCIDSLSFLARKSNEFRFHEPVLRPGEFLIQIEGIDGPPLEIPDKFGATGVEKIEETSLHDSSSQSRNPGMAEKDKINFMFPETYLLLNLAHDASFANSSAKGFLLDRWNIRMGQRFLQYYGGRENFEIYKQSLARFLNPLAISRHNESQRENMGEEEHSHIHYTDHKNEIHKNLLVPSATLQFLMEKLGRSEGIEIVATYPAEKLFQPNHEPNKNYSPYNLISMPDGSKRLVFNSKGINYFLEESQARNQFQKDIQNMLRENIGMDAGYLGVSLSSFLVEEKLKPFSQNNCRQCFIDFVLNKMNSLVSKDSIFSNSTVNKKIEALIRKKSAGYFTLHGEHISRPSQFVLSFDNSPESADFKQNILVTEFKAVYEEAFREILKQDGNSIEQFYNSLSQEQKAILHGLPPSMPTP